MKTKIFNLMIASIMSLVLLMSFASAAVTFTNVPTLEQDGSQATITVQSDEALVNMPVFLTDITQAGKTITFAANPTSLSLAPNTPETITINYNVPTGFEFEFGNEYSTTLTIGASTQKISFEETTICTVSDNGNLDIEIEDFKVNKGFGEDDEWFPFDEVEVEVKVENNGDEKIKDIEVEWGLYDLSSDTWYIDDSESDFNLGDGDDETLKIKFKLDDDIDELDGGDFRFYVWATGEDQEDDSDTCTSTSEAVSIEIEENFVVVDDVQLPESVSCGEEFQIMGDAWNIGEDDQEEVSVRIYNSKLDINEWVEVGDIDSFEDESFTATITLPEEADEKSYNLIIEVYDEDDDLYENDFDDDNSRFEFELKVEGGCKVEPKATVSADLQSGGKAGETLVVKATVINTADDSATYTLNVAGYSDWASGVEFMDAKTFTLDKAESKDVSISFLVSEDAKGENFFDIEVLSDGQLVTKQPISVTIEEKARGFAGITGNIISGDNWYLWGIGALNLVLVVIIIVVALRIMSK